MRGFQRCGFIPLDRVYAHNWIDCKDKRLSEAGVAVPVRRIG
jgi:hypothetical protein